MFSNLILGTTVLPNPIERYDEDKFEVVTRDQVTPLETASDLPDQFMAHESVKAHIMHSGSYHLSPFCLVIDSDVNKVVLEDGREVLWSTLLERVGQRVYDTPYSTTEVVQIHATGKKQAYRYTLQDGTQFDCTPEHRFETLIDGKIVKLPIHSFMELGLPLLKPRVMPSTTAPALLSEWDGLQLVYPQDLAEGEEIRPVAGLEGYYAVTNKGRVWQFNRYSRHSTHTGRIIDEKWVRQFPVTGGYLEVSLLDTDKEKVHKLVAQAFHENPYFASECNHKDNDVLNNDERNIEWCTRAYNLAKRHDDFIANNPDRVASVGVHYQDSRQGKKKWCARVSPRGGSRIFIGWYETEQEAGEAYDNYVMSQGWHLAPYSVRLNFSPWDYPPRLPEPTPDHFELQYIEDIEDLGIVETADIGVDNADHVYLLNGYRTSNSFNWNQHSRIYSIISIFKKYSNHVVLSSCRVDAIARDPGLVELINYFGSTNLTCAVEGVSEKICNFLQKSLMDEELYVGLAHIIQQNFASVKMYYIYTGLETDEDVEEFERHLTKVDELRRMFGKPTFEMRMSFTPLLSTLGTPLQYHGSKVQRSLKTGSNALFRIKHLCTRYGFGIRLSTSIASSDFAQTMEFLDRRGAGLLEYASLNGIYTFPRLSVMFYSGEEEITKKEFDKLGAAQRVTLDGKFYKIKAADRVVINKLYAMMNADALYPDYSIHDLHKLLLENDGKETPDLIRQAFPRTRAGKLVGTKLKITQQDGEHYVHGYPSGRKQHHMLINVNVDDITIDIIKDLIPVFTNGVTFNDVIEDKDAIYIFPSSHIKFHNNRHLGQDFKQYVSNRAFLFDSYSLLPETVVEVELEELTEGECSHLHHVTRNADGTADIKSVHE